MTIDYLNQRRLYVLINKLFNSFTVAERTREAKLEAYVEALHRIPLLYVEKACAIALRGKIGEGRFCPTAGELVRLAEELQWQATRRTQPVSAIDPYVKHTREERAAIIIGFRGLISDLKSGKPIEPNLATSKVFRLIKEE